jgi:beta-N-acetylhexosaminidase
VRRALVLIVAAALAGGCSEDGSGSGSGSGSRSDSGSGSDAGSRDSPVPAAVAQPPPPAAGSEDATSAPRPRIVQRPIPFSRKRKRDMAAYSRRHYGIDSYRLRRPRVIVQHITAGTTFSSAYNTFARNVRDPELGELPGTCTHFVIDTDGTIYQLVPLGIMCRHTVGLNYTSIGIEHVGTSDSAVLGSRRVLRASLKLTRWLMCSNAIARRDVIGHNESLSSRFHRERVARLRSQTHGDMRRSSMRVYRSKLRAC